MASTGWAVASGAMRAKANVMSLSSKWECLPVVPANDHARLTRIVKWLNDHHYRMRTYNLEVNGVEEIEVLVYGREISRIRREVGQARQPERDPGWILGSPTKPTSGSIEVTITEEEGFRPTVLDVVQGTTVTWTNKGKLVHFGDPG